MLQNLLFWYFSFFKKPNPRKKSQLLNPTPQKLFRFIFTLSLAYFLLAKWRFSYMRLLQH